MATLIQRTRATKRLSTLALRLSEPSDFLDFATFDYETALSHRGAGRLFHAEIFTIFGRKALRSLLL